MPRKPPYARIAITLPADDLAAADRLAAAQDRSRSWIIAEAVRRYAAEVDGAAAAPPLDAQRLAQLRADLALSPSERVRLAEETARQTSGAGEPIMHASYEDFRRARRGDAASS